MACNSTTWDSPVPIGDAAFGLSIAALALLGLAMLAYVWAGSTMLAYVWAGSTFIESATDLKILNPMDVAEKIISVDVFWINATILRMSRLGYMAGALVTMIAFIMAMVMVWRCNGAALEGRGLETVIMASVAFGVFIVSALAAYFSGFVFRVEKSWRVVRTFMETKYAKFTGR